MSRSEAVINKSYKDAVAEVTSLLESGIPEWKPNETYEVGSLVSHYGSIYRIFSEIPEDRKEAPMPFNTEWSAMHPASAVKILHEICLYGDLDITFSGDQIWIYPEGSPHEYNYHLVMGQKHYYRAPIHDLAGINITIAFNGLLTYRDNNLLDDYLQ